MSGRWGDSHKDARRKGKYGGAVSGGGGVVFEITSGLVIVADDQKIPRQSLQGLLESCVGVTRIECVQDGQELVRLALELLPQLVMTDQLMPGMTGLKAIELLAPVLLNTRFILISGGDPVGLVELLEDEPYADRVVGISKEIDSRVLVARVERIMAREFVV